MSCKSNNSYFDLTKILSYKFNVNIITGTRGVGKTFACKTFCIKQAIEKGKEFVFLRRRDEEIKEICRNNGIKFTNDLKVHPKLKNYEFTVKNRCLFYKKDDKWLTIGYFISLSTCGKLKSNSFESVHNLIFDEFIDENNYLQFETWSFFSVISSIFRNRPSMRVFMLGNAVSIDNPYFIDWGINKIPQKEFTIISKSKSIIYQNCDSTNFISEMKKTPVGKLITDSTYGNFAIENKFVLDNMDHVETSLKGNNEFRFNIIANGVKIALFINNNYRFYFTDPVEEGRTYSIIPSEVNDNVILALRKSGRVQAIKNAFFDNRCYFKTIVYKNAIIEFVKTVGF